MGKPANVVNGTSAKMSSTLKAFVDAANCLSMENGSGLCITVSGDDSVPKWLEISFDSVYEFTYGLVHNRRDCCWQRFQNYDLRVNGISCGKGDADGFDGLVSIPCESIGSTMRIVLTGGAALSLFYLGGVGTPAPVLNGTKALMDSKFNSDTSASNCLSPGGEMCHSGGDKPGWSARIPVNRRRSLAQSDANIGSQSRANEKRTYAHLTEDTCLTAALAQFGPKVTKDRGLVVGSWDHVPPGCSVQSRGD